MSHRNRALLGLWAAALAGSACREPMTAPPDTVAGPGTIALSHPTATMLLGGADQVATATLTRGGGFSGTVTITVTGHPAGVTASVTDAQTTGAITTATIAIAVSADAVPGTYPLVVHGAGSGVGEVTLPLTLTVVGPALDPGEIQQWAATAIASSEYDPSAWAAYQATGAPNVAGCSDDDRAWASLEPGTPEWLEVTFTIPVQPSLIRVIETWSPGSIVKVEVRDVAGQYTTVYTATVTAPGCPHTLEIAVTGIVTKISAVRISIDQSVHQDWNEIDAVLLIGRP